ncbi:miniconductance mechanosensitive channel [Gracilibacillus halotolerans]|uniref:Mechanosensing system component YbdG n=1 Tax=Gracilibacillus halotolerans TaxID=74386 RepID=A0A841RKE5_9BACI|nr:mechanosensitive ion channel domain-containing protein [Gracilibacillus halotolerans]MBB6512103.1 miniconductance mechanosensitive channel [Gracilibacillus halotolerans]
MNFIKEFYGKFDLTPTVTTILSVLTEIILLAIFCIIANFITKKVVIRIITHIVKNNKVKWDNVFLERKVFQKLSHIVPAVIIYHFASAFPSFEVLIQRGSIVYLIIVSLLVINSFLAAVNDIYQTHEISKTRPIKGYLQVLNIAFIVIGIILIIANLIGESPLILLSGIGALSAVFMLVFRDSLLGLVAGIQLTSNDMVRVGDWIEMPKYDADGDIIDISLVTVKVQNWDKTITTIPSYALISESFKNWRGMQSAGGRRIKRSIYIDSNTIQFCTPEMIENFKKIHVLKDYIINREQEIQEYNQAQEIDRNSKVNGRALTNIGVFREYIHQYLKHHPGIHQQLTLMVRQLPSTDHGLPLEIYAFTNDIRWAVYESIQSDIFDHLFAVADEFGLHVFQNPSGNDFQSIVQHAKIESVETIEEDKSN